MIRSLLRRWLLGPERRAEPVFIAPPPSAAARDMRPIVECAIGNVTGESLSGVVMHWKADVPDGPEASMTLIFFGVAMLRNTHGYAAAEIDAAVMDMLERVP